MTATSIPATHVSSAGARSVLRAALLAGILSVALAGCGDKKAGGGGTPTGQVVARLDGTDITLLEVNAELAGAQIPPNVSRREAEQAALQNIITRRMLMDVARERKLDQSPNFRLQERRASEQLLVQALAADIAGKQPQPRREDIDKFMAENPDMFANRKIWQVDQIQFPRNEQFEELQQELVGIKTMAGVEQALSRRGIEFRRAPSQIDTLGANPAFVQAIGGLLRDKPQELFMFPAPVQGGQLMLVNQVTGTREAPFVGERARTMAGEMLRNQRIQEQLVKLVTEQREKAKDLVSYQAGYEPQELDPDKAVEAALQTPDVPADDRDVLAPQAPGAGVAAPSPAPVQP